MFSEALMELDRHLAANVTGDDNFLAVVFNQKSSRIINDSMAAIERELVLKTIPEPEKRNLKTTRYDAALAEFKARRMTADEQAEYKKAVNGDQAKIICRFVLLQEAFTELAPETSSDFKRRAFAITGTPAVSDLKLASVDKSAVAFALQFLNGDLESISKEAVYQQAAFNVVTSATKKGHAIRVPAAIALTASVPVATKAQTATAVRAATERTRLLPKGTAPATADEGPGCCVIA